MRFDSDTWKLVRNTTRLCVIVAFGLVVLGVGLRVLIETTPSAKFDTIEVADKTVLLGGALSFQISGVQRESCLEQRTARFLVFRDGFRIPLTGEPFPNEALLQGAMKRADKTVNYNPDAAGRPVAAFYSLPVPRSYIHAGYARFGEQIDLAACGWLHGLLPIHPDLLLSNEFMVVETQPLPKAN